MLSPVAGLTGVLDRRRCKDLKIFLKSSWGVCGTC